MGHTAPQGADSRVNSWTSLQKGVLLVRINQKFASPQVGGHQGPLEAVPWGLCPPWLASRPPGPLAGLLAPRFVRRPLTRCPCLPLMSSPCPSCCGRPVSSRKPCLASSTCAHSCPCARSRTLKDDALSPYCVQEALGRGDGAAAQPAGRLRAPVPSLELPGMLKHPASALSIRVVTGHMWLLTTGDVASVTQEEL